MEKILIGIPARNEQNSIYDCLLSLARSLNSFSFAGRIDVIVGLHDCIDNTEEKARLSFGRFDKRVKIKCIKVKGNGIVDVQNEIFLSSAKKYNYVMFLDADTVINRTHVQRLYSALRQNKGLMCVYGNTLPVKHTKSIIGKVMTTYDEIKALRNKRLYVNGKSFMLRYWPLIDLHEESKRRARNIKGYNHLNLERGLIADDIILSLYLIDKYGFSSVKEIQKAKIYYHPIKTFRDFTQYTRRIYFELNRLKLLFPEFSYLEVQFKRKTNWPIFWKQDFNTQIKWTIYLIIKLVNQRYVQFRFILEKNGILPKSIIWSPTSSTKYDLVKANLHRLILFEGLDCSGKKTIANEVVELLKKNGIDAEVNLGPLSKGLYYKISRLCIRYPKIPDFIKSMIFALEPLIDGYFYRPKHLVTIQSSSYLRAKTRANILNDKLFSFFINVSSRFYPRVAITYYFSAPYRTRITRHRKLYKQKKTFEDESKRFMYDYPDKYLMWEKMLLIECGKNNLKASFDTSKISKVKISHQITNDILKGLET